MEQADADGRLRLNCVCGGGRHVHSTKALWVSRKVERKGAKGQSLNSIALPLLRGEEKLVQEEKTKKQKHLP